jgi:hypothetical protein
MKKVFFIVDLALAVFCYALDPTEGYWMGFDAKTGEVDAVWQFYVSGANFKARCFLRRQ